MPQSKTLDLFDNPSFAPEKVTLPWLQVLNAEDPERSGLFITLENCKAADIIIPDLWKPFKARFKSGELDRTTGRFVPNSTDGYLFTDARILVIRQGALSMFAKRTANTPETYVGAFDYKIYREQKDNLILKLKYLIYLLSENNQLLHQTPIQFTGRCVFGATFSEHLRAFHKELQAAYGRPRGQKFLINGVFVIKTASELRGSHPNTTWVSTVESHLVPTADNWRDMFVGYDDATREKLLADYELFADFDRKSQSQKVQDPPAGVPGLDSEMPDDDDDDDPADLF